MYIYTHVLEGTCRFSNLQRFSTSAPFFMFCTPKNTVTSLLDIGAHEPWLQAPFARFILFTHVICIISFVNLLMMNCISLGNKEYFIVIVIVIWRACDVTVIIEVLFFTGKWTLAKCETVIVMAAYKSRTDVCATYLCQPGVWLTSIDEWA